MTAQLRNWAGNLTYAAPNVLYPETISDLRALVRREPQLRALGTRHSFNRIADSSAALVSLAQLPPVVQIDHARQQVTISGNITYGHLCPLLHAAGFALHNLASLPHISVAGACATATHGSGVSNRNLAAQVAALELVTADGELVTFKRGDVDFDGVVVNLGALGIVVSLTLDLLPAFEMRQSVFRHLPADRLDTHFNAIMSSAYSVSLFTDWTSDTVNQVWVKQRLDDGEMSLHDGDFFGAVPADRHLHPIEALAPDQCTLQRGLSGAWHERLPHFRIDATPSAGNELQSEYFVPRQHALAALHALRELRHLIAPHLLVSEIRAIAADELWLSPCYQQDSVAFHFTWQPDWPSVRDVLPRIEAALDSFGLMPHWGKLFTLAPEQFQPRFSRLDDFRALAARFDPHGKFRNDFVLAALYGS